MRHKVFGRKLNRDIKERKALFKSLLLALIVHGKVRTTLAKAKAIKRLGDRIVTLAKEGTNTSLRQLSALLNRKEAIDKLTKEIGPRFKKRIGGYTKMVRIGKRAGDAAEEVILEWSEKEEKPEIQKAKKEKPKKEK